MIPFSEMHPIVANSIQTSLAVAVLFAIVLLVRKPFARQFGAKAAYALWLVPLARLFMPPLPGNWSLFQAFSSQPQAEPAVREFTVHPVVTASHNVVTDVPAPPAAIEWTAAAAPAEKAGPGLIDATLSTLPHLVVPLWIAGIVLMLGFAWRRQTVFHQLIRDDSSPASQDVHAMASEIATQLKVRRGFDVRTSLLNGSPLVTGLLRPVVLLPEWFEADYSPREQRDALTHELMHVKRGDLFALQAAQIVLALQWFNPLAYFSIRAFRVDQEAACDADVLRAGTSSAFSYGRTLVKAARLAGPADSAFRGANLTLAHPIKERLILMQNTAPTLRKRLLGTTLAVSLGSAALFATSSCAASASPDQSTTTTTTELAGGDNEETRVQNHRVYRFSSNHEDDNTQMVILSDPFEALGPRMEKLHALDLSDLEGEMQKLSIEISSVANIAALESLKEMDLSSLKELENLKELEGLAELGNMTFDFDLELDGLEGLNIETVETEDGVKLFIAGKEVELDGLDDKQLKVQIHKIERLADEHAARVDAHVARVEARAEADAERAEAMAEAHAARAEAMADAHEERAEKMQIFIERNIDAKAERMDELAEQMELRIETAFEDGLEQDLEAAGEVVESLADQCEDRDDDISSPEIVSARGGDGTVYRALCVNGDRTRLKDDDVKQFVENNPILSDAEKERFSQNRTYEYKYSWSSED